MSELVKINAKDYGLEETKAKEISDMFQPMLETMVELEKEYNDVIKGEMSPENCIEAKALRLKYVKVRTGTAEIHKKLKAFYLLGGRFVDGWKNAQLMASEGIEGKLMSIEKHYENLEIERAIKLQEKRAKELEKFEVDFIPGNLGEMQDELWSNYLTGTKTNYDAAKEQERVVEEARIQEEKENTLQRMRMIEISPLSEFIDNWNEIDLGKTEQAVYDGLFSDAKKKKADHVIKQEQIRKDNLRLQREAEQREEKRIADQRVKAQEAEAELKKGDQEKVKDLIADLESLKTKYEFKSAANKNLYVNIGILLDKVVEHINK